MEVKILQDLNLNFVETIYTIAFDLCDEIRSKGKIIVFTELGLTQDQMAQNTRVLFNEMHNVNAYALCRVFGNLDASDDKKIFGKSYTLELCFREAVKQLQSNTVCSYSAKNPRLILLGDQTNWTKDDTVKPITDNTDLYKQIEQLMVEVQFYTEKYKQVTEELQALKSKIEAKEECAKNPSTHPASSDIYWPYRSKQVLRALELTEVEQIVAYFSNFDNIRENNTITLLEWSVITTILHQQNLLTRSGTQVTLQTPVGDFELSVRSNNCLRRYGVSKVEDLMCKFSAGFQIGYDELKHVRNCGCKSVKEIMEKLASLDFMLEDDLCYPTKTSPIEALDFDSYELETLRAYNIQTIGQACVACQDQNCVNGLHSIDRDLYFSVTRQLGRYGFC